MENPSIHDERPGATDWRRNVGTFIAIAMAVAIAHGWALGDGLFLDDHWHQQQLRNAGWSMGALLQVTTIEPARFLNAWWQDMPVRWDYSRPVAMAWMKLIQIASAGSIPLQQFSSVCWHYVCCIGVFLVAFEVTRHRGWSSMAATLFAIYPHTAYTVGWLAAQNAIIQTTLTVFGVLLFLQTLSPARTCGPRAWRLAGMYALFVLALFARENAVVFPVLIAGADLAYGRPDTRKSRWHWHALLWITAAGFTLWRLTAFESHVPESYLRRLHAPSDLWWYLAKAIHYVVCVIWEAPMLFGPMRYDNPFIDNPADTFFSLGIVVVLSAGFIIACHKTVRGYWYWGLWILASILCVVPVLATPHSAYMGGVGLAIALVLKPSAVPARQARVSIAVCVWFAAMSAFALIVYRNCWRGVLRAEQYVTASMINQEIPPPDSDVFFINLPLINIYTPVILQQSWKRDPSELRGYVLTFAPRLLMGPPDCRVEQIDAFSFELSIQGERYFSGLLGRFLTDDMRQEGAFKEGEVVNGELFDVHILEADAQGVSRLRFDFRRPLSDDHFRFYVVSTDCGAARLQFAPPSPSPQWLVHECAPCAGFEDALVVRGRLFAILDAAARVIRTDLYLTGQHVSTRRGTVSD